MRPSAAAALVLIGASLLIGAPAPAGGAAQAAPARRRLEPREGPCASPIEERGLLDPGLESADLAEGAREWHADVGRRRFEGPVLAYVTPWRAPAVFLVPSARWLGRARAARRALARHTRTRAAAPPPTKPRGPLAAAGTARATILRCASAAG
jgi:hypothetical protein